MFTGPTSQVEYKDLCAHLGHLYLQLARASAAKAELESKLSVAQAERDQAVAALAGVKT